ncbi:MAG: DegT/DnrJ/EryC1/StrS family aminotransferase [Candidatus Omnitrophota bacterium]|jgi:dTDP-4-amino-4,6-dideoxygalactose transaminase
MYDKPLLDLKAQYKTIKRDVNKAVSMIMEEQSFILGKEVEELEKEIAAYCGTKYAVGVASGTDAIQLALKAAGVGPGDEVLTVPFTFIATAEAASNLGAKPVFVDIDMKTYIMDPALIESKITPKTKAIIPVHLYGQCADMDRILAIAKKHGLPVIEDCAQAIGATYNGRKAGSMGLAGCISFFPSKNLGCFGDGGMVVTNDESIYKQVKLMRVHGSSTKYSHAIIGYNSRLDNLQAAVLRIKLRKLDGWADKRRQNGTYYDKAFSGLKDCVTPYVAKGNAHVYHQYVLLVSKDLRDKLIEFLNSKGIESRVYYPIPLHMQECYQPLGYKVGDFPNSEKAALGTLALPVYPEMKSSDKKFIVDTVKAFYKTVLS